MSGAADCVLCEWGDDVTEPEFHQLLLTASNNAARFAERYVTPRLPDNFRYHVLLNQSFDGNATPDEVLYPQDDGKEVVRDSDKEVVALLYREGRCPEWIDVSVEAIGSGFTLLRMLCCGRFTNDLKKMYYSNRGLGPFGIKSPELPPDYVEGSRFNIPHI
jgi:hypothetical protein